VHRPGEHPQASWPAGGAGQRRRAGGARPERGSGLAGLADRVASAGGVLRVDSPSGAGTRLEADIPCP
jgi:signal transduction histidine kinase